MPQKVRTGVSDVDGELAARSRPAARLSRVGWLRGLSTGSTVVVVVVTVPKGGFMEGARAERVDASNDLLGTRHVTSENVLRMLAVGMQARDGRERVEDSLFRHG